MSLSICGSLKEIPDLMLSNWREAAQMRLILAKFQESRNADLSILCIDTFIWTP